MSLHNGHRERLKARFKKEGLDHFEKHQVLELLLFYCVPRQDTNPLAHRMLERFGSVEAVLEATPAQLKEVEGVGDGVVQFLRLLREIKRYGGIKKAEERGLSKLSECSDYLIPFFDDKRNEVVYLLCLDAKCKVISCKMVGEGSVNSAGVPIRRVVEMALAANATTVVLAHNHPSGIATPSYEDILTTRRVAAALDSVEIVLADHIVVAEDDFVSMVQSGYYRPGECPVQV